MRTERKRSESGFNHVIVRGVGQQLIFEDDHDRLHFLERIEKLAIESEGELIAWCLMGNHAHLLVRLDGEELSAMMKALLSTYALYFNVRHGRSGHLFQDRFKSEPVDSDEYLLTVVRYIHQNPVKAGLCQRCGEYEWSSYGEYVGSPRSCNTALVLGLLGGKEAFEAFHGYLPADECLDVDSARKRMAEDEALAWIKGEFGLDSPTGIAAFDKKSRNEAIAMMKRAGMTGKQIQRMTGIGRGIVDRVRLRDARR